MNPLSRILYSYKIGANITIHFLGGANEVGASCILIEIDGYRILVDVGIRMGPQQDSPLPDFPDFAKVGMPDAVLLTHAHTDHTGALPVLRNLWLAGVKIYWTPATKAITRVLLKDSAERMQREEQEEGKPPLYTPDDVEVALHCMDKEVPQLKPVPICGDVKATWIPAGHILGAAMIYIKGKHESILMTGDVSATAQLTVPSVDMPTWCKPDVMVMESTYGDRPHERGRTREANRLVREVDKALMRGGKVLLPVFSVGRAQEVILILKDAMERKQIPEFPVYVDGMVRKVNDIYSDSDFADELPKPLRRKVKQGEALFYSDVIKKVKSRDERESILAGGPCCIVASAGMLNGGISNYYASRLTSGPENLIAITGYQAKGTPGHKLQNLPKVEEYTVGEWKPNPETTVHVKCRVETFSLSAHADRDQLVKLVKRISPPTVLLVHGDDKPREGLKESIQEKLPSVNVILPANGEVHRIEKRIGIAGGRRLRSDRILSEVSAFIRKVEMKGPFRVRELAEIWFGTESITPLKVKFFEWCLSLERQFFARESGDLLYLR